jgi:hypothetical protein
MVSETHARPGAAAAAHPWPPDDTEQSVLGIDLHQTTIRTLCAGINELAAIHQRPGQPVPWHALMQLLLLGCRRPDGSFLRTLPDVFVYPCPAEPYRGSWTLAADGPPLLIIEVLSPSTQESDLDLAGGKGYSYAHAGVREYLTLDPTGVYLPEQGRGWRLLEGVYQPWERDSAGRWHSETIGAAFGVTGAQVNVYSREGRRILHEGEVEAELARLRRLAGEDPS